MKRTLLSALGITCAAILLAGCQMNVITTIEPSGAGSLTTEIGMTPDEVAQAQTLGGEAGGSVCASFSGGQMGAADSLAFEEEMRGEDTWCVAVTSFENIDELADLYEGMEFVRIRELTLREGLFVYDLEVNVQSPDGETTPGEMNWVLELPGKVGSHNADDVEGERLTWTLEPGVATEVQASSDLFAPTLPFELGGSTTWIIAAIACLCCGGVIVLVVAVAVFLLRRKGQQTA